MKPLLILPLVIPLLTGIACLLAWRSVRRQRAIAVVGTASLLIAALALLNWVWREGVQAVQIGGWPAPMGITLVADVFSALMVTLTGLMGLGVTVYSLVTINFPRERLGYYGLLNMLLLGVCGAFLTGDIFNLYVWFEVLLIASFVLLTLGGGQAQLEGALKYVTLNLMSSALFLAAVGLLYGTVGTLNMADLSIALAQSGQPGLVVALSLLFLVAFGIKAAVFPLFFWLPAAYHTPPVAVTAIFSALLTKVGVYALIRVFTLLFVGAVPLTHTAILIIAGFTMVTGVLGAVAQTEMRRLLSFHIISQIGYLLMGLGLFSPLALAGSVYFMAHVIFAKSALFLVSGVVDRLTGTFDLKKLGGLYARTPFVSLLFLVPALSLAGIPPLSGFWAKFILVRAGLEAGQFFIVAVALGVSILTLFSMTKIWAEAFWKNPGESGQATEGSEEGQGDKPKARAVALDLPPLKRSEWLALAGPTLTLGLLTVVMGLAAEPVFALAWRAAGQLLDPTEYVRAVLGQR